jgi:hypothetical protein
MKDKEIRKRRKHIKKEMNNLKKGLRKMELRPCLKDVELKQKEKDIEALREKIVAMEKERDRYILNSGGLKQGI